MASLTPWRRWSTRVLDFIYPPACPACQVGLPRGIPLGTFCDLCHPAIVPLTRPFCQTCAEPYQGNIQGDFSCPNCHDVAFAFDFVAAAGLSRGPLRETIHQYKYQQRLALRWPLAQLMVQTLARDERLAGLPWLLVPVPLHHRRFRERGYNQSAELAIIISRETGLPYLPALRRIRYTTAQAMLDRRTRRQNLAGAFLVPPRQAQALAGQRILLIDDVFTTGSTASECAHALKTAGAKQVAILAVARG